MNVVNSSDWLAYFADIFIEKLLILFYLMHHKFELSGGKL